ncbi:MAG: hypothetical protein GX594_19425 [Pirellulaceae bacterium]|nr:hypothetical protein [Pirellulaceae bacterium]
MHATFIFGSQTELRTVETLPSIGATVSGPDNSPWTITDIVRKPDGATITAMREPLPEWIRGDDVPCPITS